MNEYMEFAQRHPLMVMGFLAILGMIVWAEYSRLTRKYKVVNTKEAVLLMNRDETVVLDVREDKELREGKIKGSKHISLADLPKRLAELENHKNKPILVYCRSGNRSGHACGQLTKAGFSDVYNLSGGIVAWEGDSLPVSMR